MPINEVTRKLTREGSQTAIGWAMLVEDKGWYGRVRDERGDWSFGPATLARALKASRSQRTARTTVLRSTISVWLPAIWWSRPRHAGCTCTR
jgi:hypothetical protein